MSQAVSGHQHIWENTTAVRLQLTSSTWVNQTNRDRHLKTTDACAKATARKTQWKTHSRVLFFSCRRWLLNTGCIIAKEFLRRTNFNHKKVKSKLWLQTARSNWNRWGSLCIFSLLCKQRADVENFFLEILDDLVFYTFHFFFQDNPDEKKGMVSLVENLHSRIQN